MTGIRGVAAIWVVLFHLSQSLHGTLGISESAPFILTGFLGVDLFFFLSGAVMYHVHANDFLNYRISTHLHFLKLRLARIYPLHLFCLFFLAIAVITLPDFASSYRAEGFSFKNFLISALLVNHWGFGPATLWNNPVWSLSAEWLGYLTFPIVIITIRKFIPRGQEILVVTLLLIGLIAIMKFADAPTLGQTGKLGVIRMASEFSAGCLLYRSALKRKTASETLFLLGLAIVLVCAYGLKLHWGAVFGLALIVTSICTENSIAKIALGNPITVLLGELSFSLYLSHWPLIQIAQWIASHTNIDPNFLALMLIGSIAVLPIFLYKFVEIPARNYLRNYMHRTKYREFPAGTQDTAV